MSVTGTKTATATPTSTSSSSTGPTWSPNTRLVAPNATNTATPTPIERRNGHMARAVSRCGTRRFNTYRVTTAMTQYDAE